MLREAIGLASPAGRRARLSILIFHRVRPTRDALFPGELDAARFDDVCRWLRAWFSVLPLDQAVRRLADASLPARAAAITFDDGYADNHDIAWPVLQRHGLHAAFFIATGFLDGGRMWNDTVIEAVRRAGSDSLDVGEPIGRLPLGSIDERRAAIGRILEAIKHLDPAARLEFAEGIARRAGAALPYDLMMTEAQVRRLHAGGMQIGAHTVSHPILACLDDTVRRQEIVDSRTRLETLIDARVGLFAYPNGRPGSDYTQADVDVVRQLGFDAALSTAKGVATARSDRFQLPRFTPWDASRARFGARMALNLLSGPPVVVTP